jgi:hypothetical protein
MLLAGFVERVWQHCAQALHTRQAWCVKSTNGLTKATHHLEQKCEQRPPTANLVRIFWKLLCSWIFSFLTPESGAQSAAPHMSIN